MSWLLYSNLYLVYLLHIYTINKQLNPQGVYTQFHFLGEILSKNWKKLRVLVNKIIKNQCQIQPKYKKQMFI